MVYGMGYSLLIYSWFLKGCCVLLHNSKEETFFFFLASEHAFSTISSSLKEPFSSGSPQAICGNTFMSSTCKVRVPIGLRPTNHALLVSFTNHSFSSPLVCAQSHSLIVNTETMMFSLWISFKL